MFPVGYSLFPIGAAGPGAGAASCAGPSLRDSAGPSANGPAAPSHEAGPAPGPAAE